LKGLDKFFLISGALVVVTTFLVRLLHTDGDVANVASLKSVFPQAERFLPQKDPLPHHQVLVKNWQTGDYELIGYCFDTAQIAPQVTGYGGLIHILMGMDLSGRLVGVKIEEHAETPFFVEGFKAPWFTQQFVGKGVGDPLEIGQDVDGLSGATLSSRAVVRGIRESLATMAATLLGMSQTRRVSPLPRERRWWWETIALLGLMVFCLAAFWRRKRRLRVVGLILGLGLVGFALNSSLSVVHIVNVLSLRFPPFPAHASWYLLLLFGVTTSLLVARLYCGWLCPFGALQELLKKVIPYRLRLSSHLHRRASRLRMVLLWLVLCLVLISGNQGLLRYEPFFTAFSLRGTGLMWASLILILGASLVIDRFWCRYFCVVGAALHLLGRLGLRKRRTSDGQDARVRGDF